MARRVLSLLAAQHDHADLCADHSGASCARTRTTLCEGALFKDLYHASYASSPDAYARAMERFRAAGYWPDQIAFEVIPTLARQLGAAWENDRISFADVTIGCARLQATLHRLPEDDASVCGGRPFDLALVNCLVLVPEGGQHTLGALVLARKLRSVGQGVRVELNANRNALSELSKAQDFECILISASPSESVETLRDLVSASRMFWPESKIVIGGSICGHYDNLQDLTLADQVTSDCEKLFSL